MKTFARLKSVFLLFCLLFPALPARVESAALFPVNGVILGKTTLDELLMTDATVLEQGVAANGIIKLDSIEFGYEEHIITSLEISNSQPMPAVWVDAGFEWSLSYQSWLDLLEKLGYSIRLLQAPTLQMKADHSVMESKFEAFRPGKYPTAFTFHFVENHGTGVFSENALYKISARYINDFQKFIHKEQDIIGEQVYLDGWKRKALALSGIAAVVGGLNHETLELEEINQTSIEAWGKVLAEEWGITQRKQLLEKLTFLESKGDSEVFQELVGILKKNQNLTINQMVKELDYKPEIINQLYFVEEKMGLIGDRSLQAWDFSRMTLLCRIGYQVGFLTTKEAWDYLERALTKVENLYLSWEDYAVNYIFGMLFHASKSGSEIEAGNRGLRAYAELTNRQGTAWQLAWAGNETANRIDGNTLEDILYFPSPQYQAWKDYLKGWQSYKKGNLAEALKYFSNGINLDPKFVDLWLMMAMVYNKQNDFEKAIGAFNKYLTGNPGEYLPRIYLAETYERNDQLQEALLEYYKAIDLDDCRTEGFIGLGRIAINSGNYQLAASYLRIAESLSFDEEQGLHYTLYLLGYSYYKLKKYDYALSYFLRSYSNYQDNMYLNYYLGVCYLYNQNAQLASTYVERAEALGLVIPPEIKSLLAAAK
jgi:tetratricopeptide (TPR) repeat protein